MALVSIGGQETRMMEKPEKKRGFFEKSRDLLLGLALTGLGVAALGVFAPLAPALFAGAVSSAVGAFRK